jgi:hypothetical protein
MCVVPPDVSDVFLAAAAGGVADSEKRALGRPESGALRAAAIPTLDADRRAWFRNAFDS